ncbi:MAG TPA: ATP-binding protein [Alphaproteobacteria bacterium]|nr:ATP-binding protein [Alphaproteobacteria bacterium]
MRLLTVSLQHEHDVVLARRRAWQLAELLGFDAQDRTRIATTVSEIARNALSHAGGGKVEFAAEGTSAPQVLLIRISDHSPGIAMLQRILEGWHTSPIGTGLGIRGARRLMDQLDVQTSEEGTTVTVKKLFPKHASVLTSKRLEELMEVLTKQPPQSLLEEVQRQNQELLLTLEELRQKQEELVRLNRELEDTNRGVIALYAELDEKAEHLRHADAMKSRFLSNMSHEFRVPIHAILSLSWLLLERVDGDLTAEQIKQVSFIRKAAEDLSELIDDLLDLAKIEAGKITVRPTEFEVATLFATLRGMLRPLLLSESISLIFDEPVGLPPLFTDESKVSQILRNLISNALKFTPQGEVRVSATLLPDGEAVRFTVADTGIGIAPEDQEHIFEEYIQVEHPLQQRVKGTGLGLPLCKKLATLLGGNIALESAPGVGSRFSVMIPLRYQASSVRVERSEAEEQPDPKRPTILVVEDEEVDLFLYRKFLQGSGFQLISARTVRQAREVMREFRPQVIILDIWLPGEDSWAWLAELKGDEATRDIPVVVVTTSEDQRKGLALGADAYRIKPIERIWLLETLERLTRQSAPEKVLIIDDDAAARYVLGHLLAGMPYRVCEAACGREGLVKVGEEHPQMVFLDLTLPDISGFEVLAQIRADPTTRDLPIVVYTARPLDAVEQQRLAAQGVAILSKATLWREQVLAVLKAARNGVRVTQNADG